MNLTAWSDEFSVGIKSIDEQHKKIVNMIKTLHDALDKGKAPAVLDKIINGLLDYTGQHFTYEEELFDKYGYPDAGDHKKEHAKLDKRVLKLKAELDAGSLKIGEVLLLELLYDLLQNHILKTDKKYSAFLVGKGVK